MEKFKLRSALCFNADKTALVPDGHPDAAFVYGPPGREVPLDEAVKFGIADQDGNPIDVDGEVVAEAEPPAEEPEAETAETEAEDAEDEGDEGEAEKPETKPATKPATKPRRKPRRKPAAKK